MRDQLNIHEYAIEFTQFGKQHSLGIYSVETQFHSVVRSSSRMKLKLNTWKSPGFIKLYILSIINYNTLCASNKFSKFQN